jgi:hypothetical protein
MKFYLLNWVQFSCDFGKVVPSGTTQGKVCPGAFTIAIPQRNHKNIQNVFLCTEKKKEKKNPTIQNKIICMVVVFFTFVYCHLSIYI